MKDVLNPIQSPDGLFHEGDPQTGALGTRVRAQWLNDVQAHLQDFGKELSYLLSQARLAPDETRQNQVYEAILAVIEANRKQGSTTQVGEVQLTDRVDLDDSTLAGSARAVKTAHDKAEQAKTDADNANANANNRVLRTGDTMTGDLNVSGNISNGWAGFIHPWNKGNGAVGCGMQFKAGSSGTIFTSVESVREPDGSSFLDFRTSPAGDVNTRHDWHTMRIDKDGYLWAKQYGWLHDFFTKNAVFTRTWYPSWHKGCEIYKIGANNMNLMITLLRGQGQGKFNLPQRYNGHVSCHITPDNSGCTAGVIIENGQVLDVRSVGSSWWWATVIGVY